MLRTDLTIKPTTRIIDALRALDLTAEQFLAIVDEEGKLAGTLTDGDVRRGILRGIPIDSPVSSVMNQKPTVGTIRMSHEQLFAIMRAKKLRHIPVIDGEGRLVRIESIASFLEIKEKENPVILMVGGLGTRLRPLTDDCPKPLLKVGGRPLLETIIINLSKSGFTNVYLSVNYRADMIEDYFGDGASWGVNIRYIHETKRMGTAGSLTLLPDAPRKPLIVMNGDLLTKVNFEQLLEFHNENNSMATMCVREYEYQVPYGVVQTDKHRITSIVEKPIHRYYVNAGIYALNPEVIQCIPRDTFFDMPMLFDKFISSGQETAVFPIREYWLDIGRIDDFTKANLEFMEVFG